MFHGPSAWAVGHGNSGTQAFEEPPKGIPARTKAIGIAQVSSEPGMPGGEHHGDMVFDAMVIFDAGRIDGT